MAFQAKKKKTSKKHPISLPLPLPISIKDDQIVKNVSEPQLNLGYTALLRDNHLFIKNQAEARQLFNYGYFGKNEFSRSGSKITDVRDLNSAQIRDCEYSLNIERVGVLTKERLQHRNEWSMLIEKEQKILPEKRSNFHLNFLNEFVNSNIKIVQNLASNLYDPDQEHYCRVNITASSKLDENIMKISNSPFSYKIFNFPRSQLIEDLSLIYEETFFLVFGLGCLEVLSTINFNKKECSKILTIDELWQEFNNIQRNFAIRYAVYHKLRSKGWILKSGIKYGCDFMVYFKGPDEYHASFGIIVRELDLTKISSLQTSEDLFKQSSLIRINETAAKELIICYVIYESPIEFSTPSCLQKIKIFEVNIKRWVPKENRTLAKDS